LANHGARRGTIKRSKRNGNVFPDYQWGGKNRPTTPRERVGEISLVRGGILGYEDIEILAKNLDRWKDHQKRKRIPAVVAISADEGGRA